MEIFGDLDIGDSWRLLEIFGKLDIGDLDIEDIPKFGYWRFVDVQKIYVSPMAYTFLDAAYYLDSIEQWTRSFHKLMAQVILHFVGYT